MTVIVMSYQDIFEDDYDVIYISNDKEYKKMYSEYSSVHYSIPYEIYK